MADKQEAAAAVTEEDLMKSIKALEAPAEEPKSTATPEVKVEGLAKSAVDAIKEGASEKLLKALDVSDALTEIVGLLGAHVDNSLTTLAKSLQASAERDLGVIRVLGDMRKSIGELTEKIESFGEGPTKPLSIVNKTDILEKKAGTGTEAKKPDAKMLRKQIADGLEQLMKSAAPASPEANRFMQAAIKFESTGEIDDLTMRQVQKLYSPAA